MKKHLAWVLPVVAVVAFVCLVPVQMIIGDGALPLAVTVVSESRSPIASVSCEVFSTTAQAQYTFENLLPPERSSFSIQREPFHGEVLEVVPTRTSRIHSALLWSKERYSQMRWLVVIAQYRDGKREGRLVEIPDLRENRSLTVRFP